MKYEIDSQKLNKSVEIMSELEKLLTERISDLHEVPGMMQARHAYIFYREKLLTAKKVLLKNAEEVKHITSNLPIPRNVFIVQGENLLVYGCFDNREKAEKFIRTSSTMNIKEVGVI